LIFFWSNFMRSLLCALRSTPSRLLIGVAILSSVALISGCAKPSASANVYTYGQAQRDQVVRNGTIVGVRPITLQNDRTSGAGVVAGGAVGGVIGSTVGGGTGRTLAVLGGAILGALAGDAVEERVGKKDGLEITVRLDNGETRVIAQEADVPLVVNQRVQVVSGAGPTRVTPVTGQ
jgi:outer membrane lipoprotein SlyB